MARSAAPTVHDGQPAVRRRGLVLGAVLALVLALLLLGNGAQAELADPVEGHAVVQPGETLWDVAAMHAPDGVDPRAYLQAIGELNGLDGAVDPWTVVLLPAR